MLKFVTLEGILSCNNSPKIGANQQTAVWTFILLGLAAYIYVHIRRSTFCPCRINPATGKYYLEEGKSRSSMHSSLAMLNNLKKTTHMFINREVKSQLFKLNFTQ